MEFSGIIFLTIPGPFPTISDHNTVRPVQIIGQAVDYTTTMFAFKFLVVKQFPDLPMSGTDGRTYSCCHHSSCPVDNCDSLSQYCIIL